MTESAIAHRRIPPPPPAPCPAGPVPEPAGGTDGDETGPAVPAPPPGHPGVLAVRPWEDPVLESAGHDPRSAYVERFWLGVLGPSSVWLLRRFARELDARPEGVTIPVADLARSIGVGTKGGHNSPFARTLDRLATFGLAQRLDEHTIAVRRRLPALSRRQVQRLPAAVRDEHAVFLERLDDEPPVAQMRRRARALALSLLELGETREEAERQLHRWRFHPAIAYDALRWATAEHRQRRRAAEEAARLADEEAMAATEHADEDEDDPAAGHPDQAA